MNEAEYHQLAALEDRLWHFEALHANVQRAFKQLGTEPGAEILDAGCGTGGLLRRMGRWHLNARLRGLDYSPLAVDIARRTLHCEIVQGSITSLPFADGSFDRIVSLDVLCQVEDAASALAEFARCLRPAGAVLINVPAYQWLWSYHDESVQSHHRFSRGELLRRLRAAGLNPVYATYWNTLLFPAVVLRRKLLPAPKDGSSDVRDYPFWVSAPLRALLVAERALLNTGARLPFGLSVFVVARKPAPGGWEDGTPRAADPK